LLDLLEQTRAFFFNPLALGDFGVQCCDG
jgi:hypothetical protein